jgi:hypothetical protein
VREPVCRNTAYAVPTSGYLASQPVRLQMRNVQSDWHASCVCVCRHRGGPRARALVASGFRSRAFSNSRIRPSATGRHEGLVLPRQTPLRGIGLFCYPPCPAAGLAEAGVRPRITSDTPRAHVRTYLSSAARMPRIAARRRGCPVRYTPRPWGKNLLAACLLAIIIAGGKANVPSGQCPLDEPPARGCRR